MSCEEEASTRRGDCLKVEESHRPFDHSATAWLVGQGVRYLNTVGKEGELAYRRVIELLQRNGKDTLETVRDIVGQAKSGDTPLRWCLLHVLGDAGDATAAEFLVSQALRPLPELKEDEGCEGQRDAEMLVSTMAVQAVKRIARRDRGASEYLLKIMSERPTRAVLIEAVKAATELGLDEKARDLLPEEDRWIFDIRKARTEELHAEPERDDGKERGFTPPKSGSQYTAPSAGCCIRKDK